MDLNKWNLFWSMCFGLIAFLTIVGNSLSISILLKKRLRKRCHYLLIDLAIADLLVGLFTIPIYIITVMSEEKLVSRLVLDCVDMFTGFCSIFTLAVISLERLNAIARPFRHRQLSSHSYIIAMVTPWVLSLIVTSTRLLLGFSVMKIYHFVIVVIISLSTPLLIYCTSYGIIWRKQASRLQNGITARSEVKLSKTLLLITGTFVSTWLPFQVLVIVLNMCSPCKSVPAVVVYTIKLLQFGNSFSNCIIYCLRMQVYRNALLDILARCRCSLTTRRELYPLTDAPTNIMLVSFSSTLRLNNT